MRKLRLFEHISLDGVIQHTPDENGFLYEDWTEPYRSPAGRDAVIAAEGERFDLLLGRRTYDLWSGHWPQMPASPLADGINGATKYVATHRAGEPGVGTGAGHRPGCGGRRSPPQVAGRPGPNPVGQLHADLRTAEARAGR